jgi:uncharacterized membrane protein
MRPVTMARNSGNYYIYCGLGDDLLDFYCPISLFLAILVEFCASVAYTVLSRIAWITDYPDHLFLLEFARSQLATTLVLIIIFGPKVIQ